MTQPQAGILFIIAAVSSVYLSFWLIGFFIGPGKPLPEDREPIEHFEGEPR